MRLLRGIIVLSAVLLIPLLLPRAADAQTQATPENPATPAAQPAAETTAPEPTAGKKKAEEEIVVTGTRIRRKDLNTPAPVTVLSRDQISASGRVSLGEFLQALPEVGNSGANAQVNNGNDGSIYVGLRSLQPQRTLVLVNGRRMVAGGTGANSAADLSTIPAAAIERIEVLKDGASAIYGSDAIAGVVNVILRKRYDGTEVGGYTGTSQHGDGQTYDVRAITGTSGDHSGILFSAGYQEQKPVLAGSRGWSQSTYDWDFVNNKTNGPTGNSSTFPDGRFAISKAACSGSPSPPPGSALAQLCPTVLSAKSSSTFFVPERAADGSLTGNWVPYDGSLYNTNPTNYLITPARRIQLFSTGDVNLGSDARAFFEASYTNRLSEQTLAPMPVVSTTIPTAPVSVSKDSLYNPFGVNITSWRRRTVEFGQRYWSQDLDTLRVVVGLDGTLGGWSGPAAGWTWDVDYNHGRTAGNQKETGQVRMPNLSNALGPSMIDPASGQPICVRVAGNAATKIAGCVPMDVLHGKGTLNDQMASYVAYTGTDFGTNVQDIFSANISGELFTLASPRPAGLAVGGDYRREQASFQNNPINGNSESSGNNAASTYGGYNVKEIYGELIIPLVGNMPGVEDLELQAAARFNDYSTFGSQTTYKVGGRWSPVRDVVLRSTYGTGFRAPNVAELYGGAADDYPRAKDPCNNPKDPTIVARCIATGVPGGNSSDPSVQFLSKHVANPNLAPETSTAFTAGIVIQPRMVRNLSITFDYYNLNVAKVIDTRGAPFILNQCYTAAVQNPDMCALIVRNSAGAIIQINDERANLGSYHTAGFDFAVRYAYPSEFGRFSLIVDGNILRSFRRSDAAGVITDGAGNYDMASVFTTNGMMPYFKVNTGLYWTMAGIGLGVSTRYIQSFQECASGVCSQDNSQSRRVSSYMPFDLFASYTLRRWQLGTTTLVAGVNNVANIDPPYIYNAFAVNSDPSGYDYIGRFVYGRVTHTF
jgi:outer membrane receptor protein involved in Fe transport